MNLKPLYFTCKLFLLLVVIVGIGAVSLLIWLGLGARDISAMNPYITSALSLPGVESHVTIGKSQLRWESFEHPAVVQLDDIVLHTPKGPFLTLPTASVTLDLWQALLGKIVPDELVLDGADITVVRRKDNSWVWVGQSGDAISLDALLRDRGGQDGSVAISGLSLRRSQLMVYDEARDFSLRATEMLADWVLVDNQHQLQASAELTLNEQKTHLTLKTQVDAERGSGKVLMELAGFNPAVLCGLLIECEGQPKLDMPLAGTVGVVLAENFYPDEIIFSLTGENGSFAFQPHFPETIPMKLMRVAGKAHQQMRQLDIELISIDFGNGTTVAAGGSFISATKGYYVTLDGAGQNMPVNDLYKYWPATLAVESRTWATTSIRDGMAEKASVKIRLEPEDFETEFFPDDFLSADIAVTNGTVEYLPNFPKAEGVDATVHFTGTTMVAESTKAHAMTGTVLPKARVEFTNFNIPATPMKIDLEVQAPAKDIIAFLQPPRFDMLQKLPVDTSEASGSTKGTISLAFDAFSGRPTQTIDWGRVVYDVKAELADLSGIHYENALKISKANGTFAATNDSLAIALDGAMNGAPVKFSYSESAKKGQDYRIKGTINESALALLGIRGDVPLVGPIGVDATLAGTNDAMDVDATLDLTGAELAVKEIDYQKPPQTAAKLTVRTDTKNPSQWRFNYVADALKTQGALGIDWESKALESLTLEQLAFGRNNLSVDYKIQNGNDLITLKGQSLDLTKWMGEEEEGDAMSLSGISHLRLDMDLQTVYMPQDQEIRNIKGHLDCTGERCESADMTATFKDKGGVVMKIAREDGKRRFQLQSDNAGNLLRAFDVVEQMEGGDLRIRGEYDDTKPGNPLVGRMRINDFTLKEAPILGKILNLSSLTGLVETLSGQGISFERMRANYIFVNDVITVKNGRTSGPSLGIITEGTVNVKTGLLDLDGSLAPAYVLNSILGKIPLIGELLAGGKGEGLFAVNYAVDGNADDPKIMANPLSVFTPGFTRKFFDIFDAEPVDAAEGTEEKKAGEAAAKPEEEKNPDASHQAVPVDAVETAPVPEDATGAPIVEGIKVPAMKKAVPKSVE